MAPACPSQPQLSSGGQESIGGLLERKSLLEHKSKALTLRVLQEPRAALASGSAPPGRFGGCILERRTRLGVMDSIDPSRLHESSQILRNHFELPSRDAAMLCVGGQVSNIARRETWIY